MSVYDPNWKPLAVDFWADVFGNTNPVAVEVGPGLGEFLEAIATRERDWNFFAVEHAGARAKAVQERIDKHGLTNARIIRTEAELVLHFLPDCCVDRFYIQFPDPWWKRRHHRRRLMTPEFVAELRRTLRPGAEIEFITDVTEYFELAQEALRAEPGLEEIPVEPALLAATSFSRKAAQRGWKLSTATHRKRDV